MLLTLLLALLVSTPGFSQGFSEEFKSLENEKNSKIFEKLKRLEAKTDNYETECLFSGDEIPVIYDTIWPFFCLKHLLEEPDICSCWNFDKNGKLLLEFEKKGRSLAFFDKKLIDRIGNRWRLIPAIDIEMCDYGECSRCQNKIIRNYIVDIIEGMEEDFEEPCMLYRCPCMASKKWLITSVGYEEHHTNFGEYCLAFKNNPYWNFCKQSPIFPGYFNWSYQTYFPFFEQFLIYQETNRECSCFWPHCKYAAERISTIAFLAADWLARNSSLNETMRLKNFSPYLNCEMDEEFARSLFVHAYFYSQYKGIFSDLDRFSFNNCSVEEYQNIHQILSTCENQIRPIFQKLYSYCLNCHPHPKIYYERGLSYFHDGLFLESFADIRELIDYAETNGFEELLTSDLYLQEGALLNNILSYDEAILSLTKAIQKDPQNKEAYFERAVAYFETGNLPYAIEDYKKSEIKPTFFSETAIDQIAFSQAIAKGAMLGGAQAAVEFVPSLFSSIRGMGLGLFGFLSSPVQVSKEFVSACQTCLYVLQDTSIKEVFSSLVPEIQELLQKWDQLSYNEKGEMIGYVIGRYSVDIFAWGGIGKFMKAYQELKRANRVLTLEYASRFHNLAKESEKYFKLRDDYKKKCWLHLDKQKKHIPGAKNFKEGKGELTITIEHLEKIASKKFGEGVPVRFSFGQAGYKETVEFNEIIGIHVVEKTNERIPTSIGDIHYDQAGGYHVVPNDPNKIGRLKNRIKK